VHFLAQRVIIYFKCKHAVLLNYIDAYLKDKGKHKAIKANRERIIQEIQAI
jgi:hypothetical protein